MSVLSFFCFFSQTWNLSVGKNTSRHTTPGSFLECVGWLVGGWVGRDQKGSLIWVGSEFSSKLASKICQWLIWRLNLSTAIRWKVMSNLNLRIRKFISDIRYGKTEDWWWTLKTSRRAAFRRMLNKRTPEKYYNSLKDIRKKCKIQKLS